MTTLRLPPGLYFRQLRALGAWWCLGSSVLQPHVLVESAAGRFEPAEPDPARDVGVALTF